MVRTNRPTFRSPPSSRAAKPLANLERVRPVYFFTPDLEREINSLEGVTISRVLSTGAEIDEIHVIAPRDRIPKKVVRDIESLLLVKFGIRVDHRKISVVQTGAERLPSPMPSRPQILEIVKTGTGEAERVNVRICLEGDSIEGVGEYTPAETILLAGSRALINAIEKLLNTQGVLGIKDVSVVEASGQRIVLAVLTWTMEGQEEILVGASVARGEPLEDAVRATFDAVNRKLVRINRRR